LGGNKMKKPDPLIEVEVGIRGDAAASLGHAARKLRLAIEALRENQARGNTERHDLVFAAGEALWAYIVQREAIGLTSHDQVEEIYGVTSDVRRAMGARPS
jgi:hypothetical protein